MTPREPILFPHTTQVAAVSARGHFKEVLRNSHAVDCGKNKNKNRHVIIRCSLSLSHTHTSELHTWVNKCRSQTASTPQQMMVTCRRRTWPGPNGAESLQIFCFVLFCFPCADLKRRVQPDSVALFPARLAASGSAPGISGDTLR